MSDKFNNVTVVCNEEHRIDPGKCALCERDEAIKKLQAWQQAEFELRDKGLWNSISKRAQEIIDRREQNQ